MTRSSLKTHKNTQMLQSSYFSTPNLSLIILNTLVAVNVHPSTAPNYYCQVIIYIGSKARGNALADSGIINTWLKTPSKNYIN